MTRKHFREMAARLLAVADVASRREAAEAFASVAVKTNPRFDRAKFFAACGL
jgi:hypothetical protein